MWVVVRSPNNQRDEDITREDYADSLSEAGFLQACRSDPVIKELNPFWMERLSLLSNLSKLALGAATCFEGMQLCVDGTMYSDSIQVKVTLNLGYRAYEIVWNAPSHYDLWLVKTLNQHQSGSGFNKMELFQETQRMVNSWKATMLRLNMKYENFGTGDASHDSTILWLSWSYHLLTSDH